MSELNPSQSASNEADKPTSLKRQSATSIGKPPKATVKSGSVIAKKPEASSKHNHVRRNIGAAAVGLLLIGGGSSIWTANHFYFSPKNSHNKAKVALGVAEQTALSRSNLVGQRCLAGTALFKGGIQFRDTPGVVNDAGIHIPFLGRLGASGNKSFQVPADKQLGVSSPVRYQKTTASDVWYGVKPSETGEPNTHQTMEPQKQILKDYKWFDYTAYKSYRLKYYPNPDLAISTDATTYMACSRRPNGDMQMGTSPDRSEPPEYLAAWSKVLTDDLQVSLRLVKIG